MWHAILFGAVASSALVLGGAVGSVWAAPRRVTGVLLAFASGTLISALAFELFPDAVELSGLWPAALGLVLGAAVFVVFNTWLDRRAAPQAAGGAKDEQHVVVREQSARGVGFALLASVTLDGLPENLALGVSVQASASLTLLVAIFASNFPEALVGAIAMRRGGRSVRFAVGIWTGTAVVLTAAVLLGYLAGDLPPLWMGFSLAFAGGAVLASLADTLMPEAFERGRPLNSFATAAGFFVSFALAAP